MGLKTTNYYVKDLGITLPTAYAIVKDLKIEGNRGVAIFAIQSDRANATALKPIETVRVTFEFNRKENPVETAYMTAKSTKEEIVYDEIRQENVKQVVPQPLYGWNNDIV